MGGVPLAETVIVAVRASEEEFALPVAASVPFPIPDGVTVHQAASHDVDQFVLEFTVKLTVLPASAAMF
jgi:hypothetical protein